jgi:hypothetical protein
MERSRLQDHLRHKKTLVPPFRNKIHVEPVSWTETRLPEILWGVLLWSGLGRERALERYRSVWSKLMSFKKEGVEVAGLTHSGIARLPAAEKRDLLTHIAETAEDRTLLRPLLLFASLPAHEAWRSVISSQPTTDDWTVLAECVGPALDSRSLVSIDCRWLRLVGFLCTGKVKFSSRVGETLQQIVEYPLRGEFAGVSAHVNASELMISKQNYDGASDWGRHFWQACFDNTVCIAAHRRIESLEVQLGTTVAQLDQVESNLLSHCEACRKGTGPDDRHEVVFGVGLYLLALTRDLMRLGNSTCASARLTLRTMAECLITLSYLIQQNQERLWRTYVEYGRGQAKLFSLKLQESGTNPSYVDPDTIDAIANEEVSEEYRSIDLGHWEKEDLRTMAQQSGLKEEYDMYYGWTSAYSHGHWGAIRELILTVCANPLHRAHRLPGGNIVPLPDVVPDACALVDKVLTLIDSVFPPFHFRLAIRG